MNEEAAKMHFKLPRESTSAIEWACLKKLGMKLAKNESRMFGEIVE